jgi:hypothetical protein
MLPLDGCRETVAGSCNKLPVAAGKAAPPAVAEGVLCPMATSRTGREGQQEAEDREEPVVGDQSGESTGSVITDTFDDSEPRHGPSQ